MSRTRRAAAAVGSLRRRIHADALDELAAAVAYHAFLALLPLLLLATAAAGLVLADDAARTAVADAAVAAVPALDAATLPGGPLDTALEAALVGVASARGPLGLLGAAGLVLAGVRLGAALGAGVAAAFRRPRPRGPAARLREALAPALLGLLGVTGVTVGAVAGGVRAVVAPLVPLPGPTVTVAVAVGVTVLDTLVVATLFRLLLPGVAPLRDHLRGGAVVAVGWAVLRLAGGAFVGSRIAAAGAVWGALAGVVTLLVLLHLLARLLLVGALVSAVRLEAPRGDG